MKQQFNPKDWLPGGAKRQELPTVPLPAPEDKSATVERAIQLLESSGKDITETYAAWRDLGFAFAHEFGEGGRDYFHRVSRFHADYNSKDCDAQYSRCLKSAGSGITLGSFYHHLKSAGFSPSQWLSAPAGASAVSSSKGSASKAASPKDPAATEKLLPDDLWGSPTEEEMASLPRESLSGASEAPEEELPFFPESVYENLPDFLQRVVASADSVQERDVLLLGALTVMSACLPKLSGTYDEMTVFANLFLFVTAPASSGKGRLTLCRSLVQPIHQALREQTKQLRQEYEWDLAEYNNDKKTKKEKPVKPPQKMLFIPANNSNTGVFQLLHDNQARGLLFETEGDTLSLAFKTDYGNYSDGFRKAFHHEPISYHRRTEDEHVSMEEPCLSALLSGTPQQVTSLISSAENGLLSRFVFYSMNLRPVWKNVFARTGKKGLREIFRELGEEFCGFAQAMHPMEVSLSPEQELRFNRFFESIQLKYLELNPKDYVASVRRLGLICFRFMMLLTCLRLKEDEKHAPNRRCTDVDFQTALTMIEVLARHSSYIYNGLPQLKPLPRRNNRKERFLEALPPVFSRQDYLEVAALHKVPPKTADNYINEFLTANLVLRDKRNLYMVARLGEEALVKS